MNNAALVRILKRQPKLLGGLGLIAVVAAVLIWPSDDEDAAVTAYTAKRGDLTISVLEGGNVEALESQIIRSEIEGREGTLILSIIEEGYQVTDEDVANGKILVELDSSGLEDAITKQEITFQSTQASLTEATNTRDIQVSQNESSIKDAERQVRFARLEFEKYMGDKAAGEILADLNLERILDQIESAASEPAPPSEAKKPEEAASPKPEVRIGEVPRAARPQASPGRRPGNRAAGQGGGRSGRRGPGGFDPSKLTDAQRAQIQQAMKRARESGESIDWRKLAGNVGGGPPSAPQPAPTPETVKPPEIKIQRLYDPEQLDFAQYAEDDKMEMLGDGEASQTLRQLLDDVIVSKDELSLAKQDLDGTRELFARSFVTKNDLDKSELSFQKAELRVKSAETALALFKKYDLAKSAEEALAAYEEALRSLHRARKTAVAELAQQDAKVSSARRKFEIEQADLERLRAQLEKCVIRAKTAGLVVYGGGSSGRRFSMEEQIREGATVRERQVILTIPDMKKMSVKVKIDESEIKKVVVGQKARVTLDAEPDKPLSGAVTKVGVLPDSENRWFNPDQKVYVTEISVDGVHEWLKPGMSAQVEVLVDSLPDVVSVPLLAIMPIDGGQYCYVDRAGEAELVKVETGQFNDEFIEIRSGLSEGDVVYLYPPENTESADSLAARYAENEGGEAESEGAAE